jgi:aromatic-L-amino-acid decarboxylase
MGSSTPGGYAGICGEKYVVYWIGVDLYKEPMSTIDWITYEKAAAKLELSKDEYHVLAQQVLELVENQIEDLKNQKTILNQSPKNLHEHVSETLPDKPTSFEKIKSLIETYMPNSGMNICGAGYMGYMPIGGLFHSSLADLIVKVFNRWPGLYNFSPFLVEIENQVIRWLGEMIGFPETRFGQLTSGGSLANFNAVFISRINKLGDDISKGIIYVSDQAHHSVPRAARMAGFREDQLRIIESDKFCRINIGKLKETIQKDKTQKLRPFLIIGAGGTINTGAVDDLNQLADLAHQENLWLHVDAAWAGSFVLTQIGKEKFKGIERADSVTFDPHKALYTPFGCGALLTRNVECLQKAYNTQAAYLQLEGQDFGKLNPSMISPELSRSFRGLEVWLPLKMIGIDTFKTVLEEKLALANYVGEELKKQNGIELMYPTELAIVSFRYNDGKSNAQQLNDINQKILSAINQDGSIFLSGTTIQNNFFLRIVPFGFRTHKEHVDLALSMIKTAIKNYDR